MNDTNKAVNASSLRLYADDTTQYVADKNPMYPHYEFKLNGSSIYIKEHLTILGGHLDNKLSFKEHVNEILKKAFTKIAALHCLKHLVPPSTLPVLYKSFVLSHFEYCNPLLIGIGKTLNKKWADAKYYGLWTLMNLGYYESVLRTAHLNSLEQRCIKQSLIDFYKCYKENSPSYLAMLFKPRITSYNLGSRGLIVVQNSYNSRFLHSSYSLIISWIWNQLPPTVKDAPNLAYFQWHLQNLTFTGCQCKNCL